MAEIKRFGATWWGLSRGYVYGAGGELLAVQYEGVVRWVHHDPYTKSQRVTDTSGGVTAKVDLDPWGGETNRSVNSSQQARKYTTYERDTDSTDEAMHRRYRSAWARFDQPDPYDGAYDFTDPQSFNRYAYVNNDPVNFVDPSGLLRTICHVEPNGDIKCEDDGSIFPPAPGADRGFGGWGSGGWDFNTRPSAGLAVIGLREEAAYPFFLAWSDPYERQVLVPFPSMFAGWSQWGGFFQLNARMRNRDVQYGYDWCAREAYRKYRKEYVRTSAQAILGGAGVGVGGSAFIGMRGIGIGLKGAAHSLKNSSLDGMGKLLTAGVETAHGSLWGSFTSAFSGKMAADAVKDASANSRRLNEALERCRQQYRSANRFFDFLNF